MKGSPLDRRPASASALVQRLGGRSSVELGIKLDKLAPGELFKWFVASLLFGGPIPHASAARTYGELSDEDLLSPRRLLRRGWSGVVRVLDKGGYARYDFKSATKLLEMSTALLYGYAGDLNKVHDAAANPVDLEQRLKRLAKGIGDVTVGFFSANCAVCGRRPNRSRRKSC